jgi:hypothetical protein
VVAAQRALCSPDEPEGFLQLRARQRSDGTRVDKIVGQLPVLDAGGVALDT